MKIQILEDAEKDLINGYGFCKHQLPGLDIYFFESLFSGIESLKLYAGIHAKHFGYHRFLSKRFPYAVYYRMKQATVHVYAVLDCRQNPIKIQKRLT